MKTKSLPSVGISSKQLLWIVLFVDALTVVIAIALANSKGTSSFHYFDEGQFGTYLSCFQLLAIAVISGIIFRLEKKSHNLQLVKNSGFWLIVSYGVFFLALDDAFSFHEEIDRWLHKVLNIEETLVTDLADDILVGIYIFIALMYIVSQWKTLQIFRSSFNYFKMGFALAATMVVLDILCNNTLFVSMVTADSDLQEQMILWMGIMEETAKLVAEGFFLTGVYQCWRKARSVNSQ